MEITEIPVFGYFDCYMDYDQHPIEDLTMYIVEITDTKKITQAMCLLFPSLRTRMYGFLLKNINLPYHIHYYRRPNNFKKVDYKTPVDELYATPIHDDPKSDKFLKK